MAEGPVLALALGLVPDPAGYRAALHAALDPALPDWTWVDAGDSTDALWATAEAAQGAPCPWTTLLVTTALGGSRDLAEVLAGLFLLWPGLRIALLAHPGPEARRLVGQVAGYGALNVLADTPPPTAADLVAFVSTTWPRDRLRPWLDPTPPPPVTPAVPPTPPDPPVAPPKPAWRQGRLWPPPRAGPAEAVPPDAPPADPAAAAVPARRPWWPRRPRRSAPAPDGAPPEPPAPAAPPARAAPGRNPTVVAWHQIICVGGLGGGRGASQVAAGLAQQLATQGSVLAWDWDPRGGLSGWLGDPPSDRCWEAIRPDPDHAGGWSWREALWSVSPTLWVLTAQGRWPERRLVPPLPALLTDALPRFAYVVVDVGSDWSDPRAQAVARSAMAAVVVGAPHDGPRAARWLAWATDQGWAVAQRVAWVGTAGRDRAWRAAGAPPWLTALDRGDVWTTLAAWVATPRATPALP